MKINYHKNPLYTTIDLDEHEKQMLWHKIKINEMEELLFTAHFNAEEGKYFNLAEVRRVLNPEYYCNDEKSGLDKRVDMLFDYYLDDLQSSHAGDCTCVACSCSKCQVESLLGIDTIKGLGKHSAYKIDSAFGKNNEKSLDEALETLANYNPVKGEGWERSTQEEFDKHIPRWKAEAKVAYEWLVNYKKEHFPD
jgi:hypothetical protein